MLKRLGIIPHRYAQPLFQGFHGEKSSDGLQFELIENNPAQIALKLREHELHGAFLSPIEYAKNYSQYNIISGIAVVSAGETRTIVLEFNKNVQTFSSIAVDPTCASEIVLARLVLGEKYESSPQFIPASESIERPLVKTDGVLIVEKNERSGVQPDGILDLTDEWVDITELPYVHGFWAIHADEFTPDEIKQLRKQTLYGSKSLDQFPGQRPYLEQFQYTLDDAAIEGINEFYRMAYYYGILKDIPELKLL